jgi:hypothetical protein
MAKLRIAFVTGLVFVVGFMGVSGAQVAHAQSVVSRSSPSPSYSVKGDPQHGWVIKGVISAPNTPEAAAYKKAHPYVASECDVYFSFYKENAHTAYSYGYVVCNGSTYISEQISGDHCTFYIGTCLYWSNAWNAPYCPATFGYTQNCPEDGYWYWYNIPSGWLVRGEDYACAILNGNVVCDYYITGGVQF